MQLPVKKFLYNLKTPLRFQGVPALIEGVHYENNFRGEDKIQTRTCHSLVQDLTYNLN